MARTKGALGRRTVELKAMIEGALGELGGQAYLVKQARENPVAFLALLGKLLPRDVTPAASDGWTGLLEKIIARSQAAAPKASPSAPSWEPPGGIGAGRVQ
jgi:hypothetical protein